MNIDPSNQNPWAPQEDLELRYTISPDWTTADHQFVLNEKFVRRGKQILYFKDISRIRHGSYKPSKFSTVYFFVFMTNRGISMEVAFQSMIDGLDTHLSRYLAIEARLQTIFGDPLILRFHQVLCAGKELKFGNCTVTRQGISFEEKRWFRSAKFMIPWEYMQVGESNQPGCIGITNTQDPDIATSLPVANEWNGHYFAQYMQRVVKDLKMLAELKN